MQPISGTSGTSTHSSSSQAFGPFMEAAASGGPMIGSGGGKSAKTLTPAAVRELQAALVARGFKIVVDGRFGPQTRGAVMSFQRATNALPVDGIVGPITMRAFKGFAGNVAAMVRQHFASPSNFTAAPRGVPSVMISSNAPPSSADAYRAQIARWAVEQADNPNIGYSQTKGRFGNATDSNGVRYFDCSGLVYSAYKQAGVTLGGNWTGAMRSTWPQWAQQVDKNPSVMKPGDLLLMNGHVVMYIGNGKCVGAQTGNTNLRDQVTTNIDVNHYLKRPDCIVLRPNVPAGLAG